MYLFEIAEKHPVHVGPASFHCQIQIGIEGLACCVCRLPSKAQSFLHLANELRYQRILPAASRRPQKTMGSIKVVHREQYVVHQSR
jgi:hypothetical protein